MLVLLKHGQRHLGSIKWVKVKGRAYSCRQLTPHPVLFLSEDEEEDVDDEDGEDAVDGLDSPDGQPKRRKKKKFKKKLGSRKIRYNLSTKPQDFQVKTCSSSRLLFVFCRGETVFRHLAVWLF